MSDLVLRRNPDTNEVEKEVVTYEKFEVDPIKKDIESVEAELKATNDEINTNEARHEELLADKSSQESELADLKSGLETYYGFTGEEPSGTDSTEEAVASKEESGAEDGETSGEGEAVEVPVNANPADNY